MYSKNVVDNVATVTKRIFDVYTKSEFFDKSNINDLQFKISMSSKVEKNAKK